MLPAQPVLHHLDVQAVTDQQQREVVPQTVAPGCGRTPPDGDRTSRDSCSETEPDAPLLSPVFVAAVTTEEAARSAPWKLDPSSHELSTVDLLVRKKSTRCQSRPTTTNGNVQVKGIIAEIRAGQRHAGTMETKKA